MSAFITQWRNCRSTPTGEALGPKPGPEPKPTRTGLSALGGLSVLRLKPWFTTGTVHLPAKYKTTYDQHEPLRPTHLAVPALGMVGLAPVLAAHGVAG